MEGLQRELTRANFKKDHVSDLTALFASKYGIPAEDLAILIRHEPILSGEVRVEYYNYDFQEYGIDKKISEMKTQLTHGHIIFVEPLPRDNNSKEMSFEGLL